MTLISLKNRENEVARRNNFLTFDDIFNNFFETSNSLNYQQVKPLSNIFENKDNFKIELAIPGVKKENIKINLDKNVLSISSEIENENVEENNLYQRREFNYSSFERAFTLPKSADLENIQANFRDGMLEITITKREEAKDKPARSIEIQ